MCSVLDPAMRLVVVGPRGAGKSAFINFLLGKNICKSVSNLQSKSVTTKVSKDIEIKELDIFAIDTPSLAENESLLYNLYLKYSIFIICLIVPIERRSSESTECFGFILNFLLENDKFREKTMIIFTKEDNLSENESLDDFKKTCPAELHLIFGMCKMRNIAINSTCKGKKRKEAIREIKKWVDQITE